MQSLEAACEEGERAAKRLKALRAASQPLASCFPSKEDCQPSTSNFEEKPSRFDLFEELRKLQESDSSCEEEEYDSDDREAIANLGVKSRPLILEQLVQREKLNTIILNLYPGSKGYSLAFRFQDRRSMGYREDSEELIQTMIRGYEEDTLLNYFNREEIPPFILDALDKFDFLFYNGCVIAEVRNYRPAHPENKCYIHHVLLRPTQQTILADINTLTKDRPDFTSEDRDALESQILMAHTPNLCLDPDRNIENQMANIQNRSRVWNELPFYKITQKASQVAANRKRKLYHFAHKDNLLEACSRAKKSRTSTATTRSTKAAQLEETKTVIPVPNLEAPDLTYPEHPVAINVKPMTWPEDTSDCSPHLMEEYTLETDITSKDKDKPRVYHIKLSIFQRPANLEFLGELYLDRDHKKDQRNGVACRFSLGSRPNAHRYVRQFTEIFTESGRKNARISCGLVSAAARNEAAARVQNGPSVQQQQQSSVPQATPNPREQLERLSQTLQVQLNGVVPNAHPVQIVTSQHSQPVHIQGPNVQKTHQMISQELEIDALATKLEISSQQFQAAAEKAKRQQQAAAAVAAAQQQKLLSNSNIISLLNSSPASNVNSDAVVNAINSGNVVPQQRLLARKMNTAGARVLSHGNLIALNNHNRANLQEINAQLASSPAQTVTLSAAAVNNATRVSLSDLNAQLASGQAQTVTLTSVNSAGGGSYSYTAMPVKQQVVHHQRIVSPHQDGSGSSETALAALLVGTPAANRPEIASPNQANSLILEKLSASNSSGSSGQNPFGQAPKTPQATAQFVVHSPKTNAVISPMSSPPPQAANTLNVQSLNLAQLQSIPGLHNVQFQLQNFSQPISLALNVGSPMSGSTASQGLIMSLPNAQAQQSTVTQGAAQSVQGVVLNAANSSAGTSQLAHLVSSGSLKNITHHNIRTAAGSQTPGSPQFQLISQLQRPTRQQTIPGQTATISSRTLQRSTPITIKMATPSNPNQLQHQPTLETIRHYQQVNQQKNLDSVFEKLRRSSNEHQ